MTNFCIQLVDTLDVDCVKSCPVKKFMKILPIFALRKFPSCEFFLSGHNTIKKFLSIVFLLRKSTVENSSVVCL